VNGELRSLTKTVVGLTQIRPLEPPRGDRIPAPPAMAALVKNTSWETEIETRNVLFLPQ
jgi:hypothetical protein